MKQADEFLTSMLRLLNEKGDSCDYGCPITEASKHYEQLSFTQNDKHVRVVVGWVWWDLNVDDAARRLIAKHGGIQPALLHAADVVRDSSGLFGAGGLLRSTGLTGFSKNCIFETRNTYYILAGIGTRKTVELEHAMSLF